MGKDTTKAQPQPARKAKKEGGKPKLVTFDGCVLCRVRRKVRSSGFILLVKVGGDRNENEAGRGGYLRGRI